MAEAGADRGEPAAASPGASTLAALRDPRFGPYFAGSVLSNCGTWFQTLGQSLLVYRLTHSAFLLGVVNFSQFAAVFVLAPWSGGAADRFDRRRLLLVTQLAAVAVTGLLAAIVATGHANAAIVIGLVLLLGATTAFSSPTAQALVPSLVPRELLPSAIALNSVTFNLARAVGPSVGALVIGTLGIAAALAVNCLSYLALIGALLVIRPLSAPRSRPGSTGLGDSLRLVRRDHRLAAQLGLVAVIGMSTDPVATLSPAFASRELHVPDTWAGFLVGAFGAGAVLAAFTIATRRARSPGRLVVTLAMLGGGIGAYGLAPSLPIALAVLVVAGAGYLSSNTHVTTNLQLRVDDAQRGRIMALWSICFLGSRPIASLVDGALASSAGVRAAVVALALPAAVSALLVASAARRPAA